MHNRTGTRITEDEQDSAAAASSKRDEWRMKVFVCGPITNACHGGEFDEAVKTVMESLIRAIELADFEVWSAHRTESYGEAIPPSAKDVYDRDWHYASSCAAMVVVLPTNVQGDVYRTDGTFMELGWATALKKRLIVVTDTSASGRSYLLDGLLDSPHVDVVSIDSGACNRDVAHLLRFSLSGRDANDNDDGNQLLGESSRTRMCFNLS